MPAQEQQQQQQGDQNQDQKNKDDKQKKQEQQPKDQQKKQNLSKEEAEALLRKAKQREKEHREKQKEKLRALAKAQAELARFMFNSTFGVLGFGNPAKQFPHLNPSQEDLGQAFGRWGVGDGFYIVWPLLGPSTVRDSVGLVGEYFLNPLNLVDPFQDRLAIKAGDVVNKTSLRIGDYEAFKEAAIDPYASMRDGYIQDRRKDIQK